MQRDFDCSVMILDTWAAHLRGQTHKSMVQRFTKRQMIRQVLYPANVRFAEYADFQINYLNYRTGELIPSTELWIGDLLTMRINSLGCKGEELDPALGVIGVFGDSATF